MHTRNNTRLVSHSLYFFFCIQISHSHSPTMAMYIIRLIYFHFSSFYEFLNKYAHCFCLVHAHFVFASFCIIRVRISISISIFLDISVFVCFWVSAWHNTPLVCLHHNPNKWTDAQCSTNMDSYDSNDCARESKSEKKKQKNRKKRRISTINIDDSANFFRKKNKLKYKFFPKNSRNAIRV